MKLRSSPVGAAAAVLSSCFLHSQAWTTPPLSSSPLFHRPFSTAFKPTSVVTLYSSVMAESEAELVAFPNAGKVVAEGSLVSFFRGGLAVIRIEEEYFDGKAITPKVLSPTDVPAVKKDPSESGKKFN